MPALLAFLIDAIHIKRKELVIEHLRSGPKIHSVFFQIR
jgi:hypothetical protein